MKSLAKNSAVNLIYTIVDVLLVVIRAAYAGRILLADGVGQVSYVQSIAGYFTAFAQMGLPAYGVREIARVRERKQEADKVFVELYLLNLLTTTCALLAYFLFVGQTAGMKGQLPLFFVFGLNIFWNYFNVEWVYQGKEEYVFIAVRGMAVKLLSVAAMFSFVHTSRDYVIYALICCLEPGVNYIVNMLHLHKLVRAVRKGLVFRKHMKPIATLALGILLTSLYSYIDVTMLGALSTKTATGYYSYANMAIYALTTACISILSIFLPRLSYYYGRDIIRFHKLLQSGLRVQMFVSIPVCAGVFMLAPQIVMVLFGNTFLPSVTTIKILLFLVIVQTFSNVIGYQVLIATGNEKEQIPAFLIAISVNVILNIVLIPEWANNGAAAASVISEIAACVYRVCKVYRRLPFLIPWKALGQAVVSSAIMAAVMAGIVRAGLQPLLQCVLAAAAGGAAYGTANLFMKNELMMEALGMVRVWSRERKDRR